MDVNRGKYTDNSLFRRSRIDGDNVVNSSHTKNSSVCLDPFLDLEEEIGKLRRDKNAVILAHYYQAPEIQDIADFVGDSLDLSRKAADTDADMIAFCGVRFMGECAKILSPDKIVVIPDSEAGCSLEDSCPPEEFANFRAQHPNHTVVTYINCSAEVKAQSDIIVTSSNACSIISQLPESEKILFAPDHHLGAYLSKKTGREMALWPGTCIVHEQFNERELVKLTVRHPGAKIAAHPECPETILRHADHIGSTRSILEYVTNDDAQVFIIATEMHITHQMHKSVPHKTIIPAPGADGTCNCASCPYMAKNSLEKLYFALLNETPQIELPEPLRTQALKPLQRMLDLSPDPAIQNKNAA